MALEALTTSLNIIQELEIDLFDEDVDIIQKLDDEPNDTGGLTAAELKERFDRAGNLIKDYLNNTLLPGVSDTVAEANVRAAAERERIENENARIQAETEREAASAAALQEAETAAAIARSVLSGEERWLYPAVEEDGHLWFLASATATDLAFSLSLAGHLILEVS